MSRDYDINPYESPQLSAYAKACAAYDKRRMTVLAAAVGVDLKEVVPVDLYGDATLYRVGGREYHVCDGVDRHVWAARGVKLAPTELVGDKSFQIFTKEE
jgi:hypothetical protein